MVEEAEAESEEVMVRLLKCSTFGNLSSAQLKELEKDFHHREKRCKKYRKMRTEYTQIQSPDPPAKVTVEVISPTAVRIRFQEADTPENPSYTKYKIDWSLDEEFCAGPMTDGIDIFDLSKLEHVISDLRTGNRYYFRVSGGNSKGYGHPQNSTPASIIPSSWRDLDGKKSRYEGKCITFDEIFVEIQRARPEYTTHGLSNKLRSRHISGTGSGSGSGSGTEAVGAKLGYDSDTSGASGKHGDSGNNCGEGRSSPSSQSASSNKPSLNHANIHHPSNLAHHSQSSQHQKKTQKIISIKQLFASAPKFQKHLKRGIFLSCVMYSEDKLLLTNEEFLPTIKIDEIFPTSLHHDFHWLLKVAATWEDVKSFKVDIEKSGSASTFHFRLKLLQASAAMQNALGVSDLGRLYYKTIRDKGNSVVVITTINYVRSTKMISSLNARWTPLTKISSRKSMDEVADVLINSIQEQILYHQVSNIPVGRGLYLGYLKLASSVDVLRIVVPEKTPNMLPYAKIRDNPHVSIEEWTLIQKLSKSNSLDSLNNSELNLRMNSGAGNTIGDYSNLSELQSRSCSGSAEFSEAQELFRSQLNAAVKRLFSFLEIDYDSSLNHRMYNCEVIEVSSCVSLLVVLPSLENVCLAAGQSDKLLERSDLIPLPVQVFEMIHFSTYQKDFITRYARLSAILEVDSTLAQHNQREAFSTSEIAAAKERLSQLQDLQSKTDAAWKSSRWVIDLVTASRNKSEPSASLRALAQFTHVKTNSTESVVSADAIIRKSDELQLGFLHSHSNSKQSLPVQGNTGMKFSLSENHLSNFRMGSFGMADEGLLSGSGGDRGELSPGQSSTHHTRSHSHSHTTQRHFSHPSSGSGGAGDAIGNYVLYANSPPQVFHRKVNVPPPHQHNSHSALQEKLQLQWPSSQSPLRPSSSESPSSSNLDVRVFPALDPPGNLAFFPPPPHTLSNHNNIPSASSNLFDSTSMSSTSSGSSLTEVPGPPSSSSTPSSVVVIQVFAAYECGLSEGTSVRLQITNQTTARQVVDLLVKQLNAEVKAKGLKHPLYERTQDFCLVSVIGARERCLRNDFKPLLLQSPWKGGRLYVRKKSDVTSAIQMNSQESSTNF